MAICESLAGKLLNLGSGIPGFAVSFEESEE